MAALGRESSFLPTIKCSSCGEGIEISMMGEHVCGSGGNSSQPTQLSENFKPWNQAVHEKIGRVPPPPKVDTLAANRTYYRAAQLTPVSNSSGSGSRNISPLTPNSRGPGRDDYFAPKIANEYESTPPQSRRPGGYGGLDAGEESLYPGVSPKQQSSNLLQRMNTIAPGPFEMNRRPGARNAFPSRGGDQGRPGTSEGGDASPYSGGYGAAPMDRPRTANSNASFGSGQQQSQPPKMPRQNGYGGFGPPLRDDDRSEQYSMPSRAGTFPRPSEASEPPLRTPSAPGQRPRRQQSNDMGPGRMPMNGERRPSLAPDTSRPPPPRTLSIVSRPRTRDGGPAPEINLAEEFGIGNPYHSPSASMSSSASTSSRPSQRSGSQPSTQTSYETSPARSLRSQSTRKPSETSNAPGGGIGGLLSNLQQSMGNYFQNNRELPESPPPPPPIEKQPSLRGQERGRSRGRMQGGSSSSSNDRFASMDRQQPQRREPSRAGSTRNRSRGRQPSDSAAVRAICKACGDPISGKSVASADGRLTGRYHKACFVCTTCGDQFPSATFYVHDDRPYCQRDWHKANRSLCGTCDIGIEGQYLADENDTKYHPPCFRCADCNDILRDGYYDVGGKQVCERDAFKRTQRQQQQQVYPPPSRTPQPSNLGPNGRGGNGGYPGGGRRGVPLAMNGLPGGPKLGPGAGGPPPSGYPGPGYNGRQPYGPPGGGRQPPGPRMAKRMTRLGMM